MSRFKIIHINNRESPIQEPIERIERRRENVGGGNYFMHGNGGGGVPWADHKEHEPDQRLVHTLFNLFLMHFTFD